MPIAPANDPGAGAAPPPTKKGRERWVPILAGATALLLVLSGVFAGLWYFQTSDLERKLADREKTIASHEDTIKDNKKEISELKEDLEKAQEDLASAQEELEATEGENEDLASEKEIISECLRLLIEFLDAAGRNDQATAEQKLAELQQPCEEAEQLIN